MKLTSIDIIGEIERLAAACPWDHVEIWIKREPEGTFSFTGYVPENEKYGFPSVWGSNHETPQEAVDQIIKQTGSREPEIQRKRKIAELQEKIAKLEAVVIGLPPYRPNRELTNGEPAIKAQPTVDV